MDSLLVGNLGQDEPVLDLSNISVNRSGQVILRNIDLKIMKGDFVGLVGPNGSGKSTLLLTILGALKASQGSIKIYGHNLHSRKLYGKIGWVSQAASNLPKTVCITVHELVKLGTVNAKNMFRLFDPERRRRVRHAIKMVGLEGVQNTDVSRLSGGQRQRAVIARALASDADFILLDEPLVGIDRDARASLLKLLNQLCRNEGKTILMVSHDLAAMRQTAHRMVFLDETIHFDGKSNEFPELMELAGIRGIGDIYSTPQFNPKEEE
ncbi:MAG: zinc ABC transporter ATP-binding protein [Euryarchaeota archaeon]|nr:zinc ABC transporter ATP-binding protein [Euryarchaeota archaeon]|tara:strand:+ start:2856 stop:3653 length:798 start_codon:yes stop_codon:yes gene_type:complete